MPINHSKIQREHIGTVGDLIEYGECGRTGRTALALTEFDERRACGIGSAPDGLSSGICSACDGGWDHVQPNGTCCRKRDNREKGFGQRFLLAIDKKSQRIWLRYHRKSLGPSAAPIAVAAAIPSEYQVGTK